VKRLTSQWLDATCWNRSSVAVMAARHGSMPHCESASNATSTDTLSLDLLEGLDAVIQLPEVNAIINLATLYRGLMFRPMPRLVRQGDALAGREWSRSSGRIVAIPFSSHVGVAPPAAGIRSLRPRPHVRYLHYYIHIVMRNVSWS
jgi:hypothetical protein